MQKQAFGKRAQDIALILFGGAVFALGFALFLAPNHINCGGLTGILMIAGELLGFSSLGLPLLLCNIPLFLLGGKKLGRDFFLGSLLGMLSSSLLIDVFEALPMVELDPLLASLFGGVSAGFGLGLVFTRGASTGGLDIVTRLVKQKLRHVPLGRIMFCMDLVVIALTGLVYRDITKALYSAVTLYVLTVSMDMVIYGRNNAGVAMIVTEQVEAVSEAINSQLDRGATLLPGVGSYTNQPRTVILCAVKAQQVVKLEQLVADIDPDAFVIMQKAHQVLGHGFGRYSDDSL